MNFKDLVIGGAILLCVLGVAIFLLGQEQQTGEIQMSDVSKGSPMETIKGVLQLIDEKGNIVSNPEVGDIINGLTIVSIEPGYGGGEYPITSENVIIKFQGEKILTGTLNPNLVGVGAPLHCLMTQPASQLPRLLHWSGDDAEWKLDELEKFCFWNENKAMELLGEEYASSTVRIKEYTINSWPTEVTHSAILIERIR